MSNTSNVGLNLSTLRSGLPILTGALNLLAIGGGLYNFVDPAAGAKGFGIVTSSPPTPTETALTKAFGIRNVGTGLAGLAILSYLQFSDLTTTSPVAAAAVRKVLGISLVLGTVVGLGDSYLMSELSQAGGVTSSEVTELAKEKSTGHAFMAAPIVAVGLGWLYS